MVTSGVRVVPADQLAQRRAMLLEGRRLAVEIDKDPVVPDAHAHRLEAPLALVEALDLLFPEAAEMGRRARATAQVVTPVMVGTDHRTLARAGLFHERRAAMAADIVKRAHLAATLAHQQHRHAAHAHRAHVPGLGDLVGKAHKPPSPGGTAFPAHAGRSLR